jgi:TatA/E family protein of Tat protein translocase
LRPDTERMAERVVPFYVAEHLILSPPRVRRSRAWNIVLLVIVLLVSGSKKLPQAGRSLGRGTHEFKEGDQQRPDESARSASRAGSRVREVAAGWPLLRRQILKQPGRPWPVPRADARRRLSPRTDGERAIRPQRISASQGADASSSVAARRRSRSARWIWSRSSGRRHPSPSRPSTRSSRLYNVLT